MAAVNPHDASLEMLCPPEVTAPAHCPPPPALPATMLLVDVIVPSDDALKRDAPDGAVSARVTASSAPPVQVPFAATVQQGCAEPHAGSGVSVRVPPADVTLS